MSYICKGWYSKYSKGKGFRRVTIQNEHVIKLTQIVMSLKNICSSQYFVFDYQASLLEP